MSDTALETVLKEEEIYREMVSVLAEQLHAAYKREKYRRENQVHVNAND